MAVCGSGHDGVASTEDVDLEISSRDIVENSATAAPIATQNPHQSQHTGIRILHADVSAGVEHASETGSSQPVGQSTNGGIEDSASDRTLSALSANQRRMGELLMELHREARLNVDEDMLEEGFQPTVANLQTRIVILPRPDLRQEFREQAFDSCGDMWRVEHVFTSAGKNLQNVSLESLFEDIPDMIVRNERTYRVVAISSAGCGKTTVFTKVAPCRWANGGLWSHLFDMVFARELRYKEVRQAKSARNLLDLDGFSLSKAERGDVLQYVRDHPGRVCLVLDGLDETSLKKCSKFVQDVIRGEEMRGIRLVLTSRPSGDVFKLTDASRHDRKVELVGFSPEDVKQYVRKILNAQEASELLEKIDDNPHLLSMMSTPVLAYEICKLYHWRKQVPRCVADLFELMILRLAERRSEYEYQDWANVPLSIRGQILSLGSYAFRMLQEQRLVFSEKELQSYSILRDAITLGLLVACDHTPADECAKQWRFSHLTLQESLAAKFVSCSGAMSGGKIVELVEYFGPDAGYMRTFWMLLAAQLNSSCLETLVNSLMLRQKKEDSQQPMMSIADDSRQSFPLKYHRLLCEQLSRSYMNQLAEILLGAVVQKSGSGAKLVESKMSRAHSPRDDDFLQTLLQTWVTKCPAADESTLVEAVSTVDCGSSQLCRELMKQNPGSACEPTSMPFLHDANTDFYSNHQLRERRQLAFQCFAEYALHHNDAVEPVPSITACLKCEDGDLIIWGDWRPWLCRMLEVVIKHHRQAIRCVELKNFNGDSANRIPPSLRQCANMEILQLTRCPLQDDVACMIRSSSFTMDVLAFLSGPITDLGMEDLVAGISACSHLRHLTLFNCSLSMHSARLLAQSLAALSSLVVVNLTGALRRDVSDQATALLCNSLSTCTQLEGLAFAECGLSSCSLPVISARLRHWPNLLHIDLSCNDFSGVTMEQGRQFIDDVNAHPRLHILGLEDALHPLHPLRYPASYHRPMTLL